MDLHASDQEQIDALRDWWKENGSAVLAGVVLGLGAIFGWRAWQAHVIAEAVAASAFYDTVSGLVRDNASAEKVSAAADRILAEHPKSSYATYAHLILARAAVDAADLELAATHLRAALDQTREPSLARETRLRLARVLAAQGQNDDAITLLDTGTAGEYLSAFAELRGDIEVQRGNVQAARTEYETALKNRDPEAGDVALLELKLDNLGHGTGS